MATKRKAATKKSKGYGNPANEIDVDVKLGGLTATQDQLDRLKAFVENIVITWATVDAGMTDVQVFCKENPILPPPPDTVKRK